MFKRMLTMAAILSFSQVAVAEKTEIFKCIDAASLNIQEECVANTLEQSSLNNDFYSELETKTYESTNDAFASITYYPKLNIIEVKSIEPKISKAANKSNLLASR
ncbi:hypothetical protein WNY51_05885 [Pseudocolwellia sp. AS88]|uniref:hypothetical protein n=1 Tax=Pseudocolwellia sp. AS88 TaxID=3063958 RepID=UPI0026EF70A3|nr:hypothetical protein [Pseudocolwellia sp. AS88]MDO7083381.1 hypothetical protein [Pseudocolwellia sp. AS88]